MGINNVPISNLAGIPEEVFRNFPAGLKLDIFREVYYNLNKESNNDVEIIEPF